MNELWYMVNKAVAGLGRETTKNAETKVHKPMRCRAFHVS